MRVLVCGGRTFSDRDRLFREMDRLHAKHRFTTVIHGDARGTDQLAGDWAKRSGVREETFEADWLAHGKAAGPIRNQEMLVAGKPDLVVSWPGGPGTADMLSRARQSGLHIISFIGEKRND